MYRVHYPAYGGIRAVDRADDNHAGSANFGPVFPTRVALVDKLFQPAEKVSEQIVIEAKRLWVIFVMKTN